MATAQYDEERKNEVYDKEYWSKYVEEKFEESKNWRSTNTEFQWFINYMYYAGNQNVQYDKRTNRLIKTSRNPLNFYINYTYMITRAVRNAIIGTQPQWDVDALPYGKLDPIEGQVLGEYLGFEYDKLNMEEKINKVVLYGLLYGIGIFQYGYDANADNGEGNTWVEVLDPFDTYIDPYATGVEDARYVVKVVSRPLELVRKNKYYDQEAIKDIQSTEKMSESDYKDLIVNNLHDTGHSTGNVLLKEAWCVTEEGIRVITTCENAVLRNEITDFTELPFEFYFPDININTIYGEGWVKNIVGLNKALNTLESSRLEYNLIFNKGKLLAPKGAGIKTITNQNGQIVHYKPGFEPKVMDMKPMGSDVERQIGALSNYIQQIGSTNEALLGQTPPGIKSGVALDTLLAASYANLKDPIANLSNTLEELGQDLLRVAYRHQTFLKPFKTSDGNPAGVIGNANVDETQFDYPVIRIPENPEVKVRITSGTAYTKEGKKEVMQNLRGMGAISNRTFLEAYDIDPIQEERRMKEELEAMQPEPEPMIGEDTPLPEGMEIEI